MITDKVNKIEDIQWEPEELPKLATACFNKEQFVTEQLLMLVWCKPGGNSTTEEKLIGQANLKFKSCVPEDTNCDAFIDSNVPLTL